MAYDEDDVDIYVTGFYRLQCLLECHQSVGVWILQLLDSQSLLVVSANLPALELLMENKTVTAPRSSTNRFCVRLHIKCVFQGRSQRCTSVLTNQ